MRFIERYTWIHVLITSVIGAGLVAVAAHFVLPARFTAHSSLLLDDRPDIIATLASADGNAGATSLDRLQAILVSREIRLRIIEKTALTEKLEVDEGYALDALTAMSTIKSIGQDGISIDVTAGGFFAPGIPTLGYPLSVEEARALCAEIANLYIAELGEYLRDSHLEGARQTTEFLRERHDRLQRELSNSEDRLQSLRAQYELLDPDSKAARLGERIRTLEQARADAAAEADATADSLAAAESQLSDMEARRISSQVQTRNPLISSLQQQLLQRQTDLATELATGKTAEHRDVVQIQSAIDNVEAQLLALEDTVMKEMGEQPNPLHDDTVKQVVQLRVQLAGARARRAEVDSLLAGARSRMAEMPAVAREYVEIQRMEQLAAERLSSIEQALWMAQYQEARAEMGGPFTVLDTARAPSEADGPPTLVAGLIALAVLLVLQGLLIIDRRWFGG